MKKANKIRKKGEPWKKAIKRASKGFQKKEGFGDKKGRPHLSQTAKAKKIRRKGESWKSAMNRARGGRPVLPPKKR